MSTPKEKEPPLWQIDLKAPTKRLVEQVVYVEDVITRRTRRLAGKREQWAQALREGKAPWFLSGQIDELNMLIRRDREDLKRLNRELKRRGM